MKIVAVWRGVCGKRGGIRAGLVASRDPLERGRDRGWRTASATGVRACAEPDGGRSAVRGGAGGSASG